MRHVAESTRPPRRFKCGVKASRGRSCGDEGGRFVEIQGTAETEPFDREMMNRMIEAASIGVDRLIAIQRDLIVQSLEGKEFRAMVDPAIRKKINWKEDAS